MTAKAELGDSDCIKIVIYDDENPDQVIHLRPNSKTRIAVSGLGYGALVTSEGMALILCSAARESIKKFGPDHTRIISQWGVYAGSDKFSQEAYDRIAAESFNLWPKEDVP